MELNEFETRPFAMFDRDWALVTAGDLDSFNSMTVSWGSAGTLWNKPVIMVTGVRKIISLNKSERHTPFFIWNIRINIACSHHMKQSKYDNPNKSEIRHPISNNIHNERNQQENRSCMLQKLFLRIDRIDTCDDCKHN